MSMETVWRYEETTVILFCWLPCSRKMKNLIYQWIILIGSMLKALNGLLAERKEAIFYLIIIIVFLITSTAATNLVVMTSEAGIICSCIIIVCSIITWNSCLRIFNRFKVCRRMSLLFKLLTLSRYLMTYFVPFR
jgi:hypothetical protein